MIDINYIIIGVCTILSTILGAFANSYVSKKKEQKESEKLQLELKNIKSKLDNFEIIDDSSDVLKDRLLPIIEEMSSSQEDVKIDNLGLDLETVMPWINQKIVAPKKFLNIQIKLKTLIIDDTNAEIKEMINGSSNIRSSIINSSIDLAKTIMSQKIHNFFFEIKQYSQPPLIHGFIINNKHLFIGFTEIIDGKLVGGINPYLYLKKDESSSLNKHYFNFFKQWFDYYWDNSKTINNTKK